MDEMGLTFRKGDLLAIGGVLLCAALLAAGLWVKARGVDHVTARIYRDGELVREVSLDRDTTFDVKGDYTNTVTVKDGAIAITRSDCPGSDCVHSGWVSGAGRAIVCLPNRVEIRLTGVGEVDAVIQ